MSVFIENIAEVALSLPENERARLAESLYQSLEHIGEDQEIHDMWAAEVHRRLAEIESGEVEAIDGKAGLARVRAALRK